MKYSFIEIINIIKKKKLKIFLIFLFPYIFLLLIVFKVSLVDIEIYSRYNISSLPQHSLLFNIRYEIQNKMRTNFKNNFKYFINQDHIVECGYHDYDNFISKISFLRFPHGEFNLLKIKNIHKKHNFYFNKCNQYLINSLKLFYLDLEDKYEKHLNDTITYLKSKQNKSVQDLSNILENFSQKYDYERQEMLYYTDKKNFMELKNRIFVSKENYETIWLKNKKLEILKKHKEFDVKRINKTVFVFIFINFICLFCTLFFIGFYINKEKVNK